MEMDDNIPQPDELEWLEANSHLHEEDFDEDFHFEPPIEEEEQQQPQIQPQNPPKQTLSIPPVLSTPIANQINPKKRFRFDKDAQLNLDPGVDDSSSLDGKRSRVDDVGAEIEEDWLRYSPTRSDEVVIEEDLVVEEEGKIVSRFASEIEGDCIPITGPDGERVYTKIDRFEEEDRGRRLDVKHHTKGLIPESINVLMQRVEQDAFAKVLQASVETQSDISLPKIPVVNEQLWVDKYAPNSFMELLSDEQTNREVLLWLKQWDSCVFGSEIKSTTDDVLSSLKRHTSVAQHQKVSNRGYFGKNRESRFGEEKFKSHNNLDQGNNDSKNIQELWNKKHKVSGPPEQKILLLCGPPGLGKTTLSHVAARHCGYRVMEINASDDRSSSTIEAKILDVVQMNSVIADSKPKCLVIDEIDGALGDGKGAVEVILKMVSAERKSGSGKENVAQEEHSGNKSSKKKRKDTSLLRPVICICNDLYAPALRPLRQVAKVHTFVQPTVSRIVSRLKYICSKEGLKTSSIALTALAQYTECDIRSCLNTLQFLNKKKETLSALEISSQVVGRKDTSKSVFDVWKEIFQKKRVKRERKPVNGGSNVLNEFDFLHSLISNRGDYDLIMDGIHENILQLHYHDPVMRKTVKCLHNLGVSDIFHNYIMRTQKMSLQVYQPGIAIGIHNIIAQVEKPNIEWPKSFQRYRRTLMEKVDTLHSWHNKISPYISRHLSTKSFVEDTVSPLLHILSPPTIRPVASHILSDKEKNEMAQLVDAMVSYSITYKNVKSDPLPSTLRHEATIDVSMLSFDPPIGDFINFKDYKSCHFVLALVVKQVLVHEVEKQKILQAGINRSMQLTDVSKKENKVSLRDENLRLQSSTTASADTVVSKKNPSSTRQCETNPSISASSKSATAIAKPKSSESTKKPSSGPTNFFDRFRKVSSKGGQSSDKVAQMAATMERDSRPLLFKFNEGFTNAVKRPVRMREFLL
ncbi:hypothetical protein LguiA_030166 [Lonicera macranthoides]